MENQPYQNRPQSTNPSTPITLQRESINQIDFPFVHHQSAFNKVVVENLGIVSDNSIQEVLAKALGRYAICELLIGANTIDTREGYLCYVGKNYFMLYQPETATCMMCDLYSLKYITFFAPNMKAQSMEIPESFTQQMQQIEQQQAPQQAVPCPNCAQQMPPTQQPYCYDPSRNEWSVLVQPNMPNS